MTKFKLNKIAFCAIMSVFLGGCAFFGFIEGTTGKFGDGQSVCNNINKSDIFPRHYGGNFSNIGRFIGIADLAQVETALGVQIYYTEIKRSDKESVCGFVMATNKAYNNVNLTSQDIARLEKALADSGELKAMRSQKSDRQLITPR